MVSVDACREVYEEVLDYHFKAGSFATLSAEEDSPKFEILTPKVSIQGNDWHISLKTPKSKSNKKNLGVFIYCSSPDVTASFDFSFQTFVDPNTILMTEELHSDAVNFTGCSGWGWPNVCQITKLEPVDDIQLKLTIKLRIYSEFNFSSKNVQKSSMNLGKSIRENLESDFVVVLQDETLVPAHRLVLSAFSPVFKSMLSHEISESLDGQVKIDDFPPQVVRQFIDALYNEKLPDKCDFKQMFAISDKYKVDALAKDSLAHLAEQLNTDNACFIFGSMKRCGYFQGTELEKRVARFVFQNLNDLESTDDFQAISKDPALLMSILQQRGKKRKREPEKPTLELSD